jgi:class 3 adenylate cyclase
MLDVFGSAGGFALPADIERVVTTLLMSDIVESTVIARRLGDAAWRQLLGAHNRAMRTELDRARGREIATTGDGFVATFASAISAARCALAMRDAAQELGVPIRVGIHTGEVEIVGEDVAGVTVHAAARVMGLGGGSEVIVSSLTRALLDGSGLRFEGRGRHHVKGLDEPIDVSLLIG